MPLNRYLRLRNWRPRPDGHIELREGYTQADMSLDAGAGSASIHSISTYMVATPAAGLPGGTQIFPNGIECIFFWRGIIPYLRRLDTGATSVVPISGAAIASDHRWQYALGKSGYLYMHNGTDMKFFDGIKLRDIGLPTLSTTQAGSISVAEGIAAPTKTGVDAVSFSFVTPVPSPPTLANVTSGFMYMAYFDKSDDVLAPSSEPLSGAAFPNGSLEPSPTSVFLQANGLPAPKPGSVILLYYPAGGLVPTLMAGTVCRFYSHAASPYASQFEYMNPADTYGGGVLLPVSPITTFPLADNQGLLFNPFNTVPGHPLFGGLPDWTLEAAGHIYPMVVAGMDNRGHWDGTTAVIWTGAVPGSSVGWTMTVRGKIAIPAAGEYNFILAHDDGALMGFGGGASYVSGPVDGALQTITADQGYPVVINNAVDGLHRDTCVVSFPAAGVYDFEIDYCNWETSQTCCLYNGDGSVIKAGVAPTDAPAASPQLLTEDNGQESALLTAVPGVGDAPSTVVNVKLMGHALTTGDVFVLSLRMSSGDPYPTPFSPVLWKSNGPFTATNVDADNFTFNTSEAPLYDGATPITFYKVVQVTTTDYTIDTDNSGWPMRAPNGIDTNAGGTILLPSPLDPSGLLPASAIGGAQPGYQFYASIYNPLTGHVGNRVPIGKRLDNDTDCTVLITGLPSIASMRAGAGQQRVCWGNGTELVPLNLKRKQKARQGQVIAMASVAFDSEWKVLIGRTGDGGEVPYAVIDSAGDWIFYDPNLATANPNTLTISSGLIDGNSELPTENYIPPPFACFWREGDRQCGAIASNIRVITSVPFEGIPTLPNNGFIDTNYTSFWRFSAPGVSGTGVRVTFATNSAADCSIAKVVLMRTLAGSTAVIDTTTLSTGLFVTRGTLGVVHATFAVDGLHDYWIAAFTNDSSNSGMKWAGSLTIGPSSPAQMYAPSGFGDQTGITDLSVCVPNSTGWKLLSNFEILDPITVDVFAAVSQQPFVYRSGSELDATTGIFVGDPAQAWSPARIETFPTAEAIYGGFGSMQESWVFTKSHCGQLSELSGEVAWNGPYNFGVAGPEAFDTGWNSLPFWVSHDKQLCTMMPGGDGPMSISTEYEAALLARIGDDSFNPDGTPNVQYLAKTEVRYFRDPSRLVEVLRIKCLDKTGTPFVVIHDFNLRDDSSPYGQGYEEIYGGALSVAFTQQHIRDAIGHARMWAGGNDGNLYQFYSGGDDHGTNFTADAVQLRYIGGERTATKTIEWYGDGTIQWYIFEPMLSVDPTTTASWIKVSTKVIEVPADAGSAHWMADVDRPEMTHCYLWAQLVSHPADAVDPTNPMAFTSPPHMPLENYGRILMAVPLLGDARGK
jgi:hypothetical protein